MSVILVLPPFASVDRPSVGLGTLQSILKNNGVSCNTLYANLNLANIIGLDLYEKVCLSSSTALVGELLFASYAFPECADKHLKYKKILGSTQIPVSSKDEKFTFKDLEHVSSFIDNYINNIALEITSKKPKIVGFSTTFQQTCASIAIASRIKQYNNNIKIVIGGANCSLPMGEQIAKSSTIVDLVFSGESERSFVDYCLKYINTGVDYDMNVVEGDICHDLNALPIPCYDDYFERKNNLKITTKNWVSFESSRGCWWGDKSNCLFCGLNGCSTKYRSKSNERMNKEILHLISTYDTPFMHATDNIMGKDLPKKFFRCFKKPEKLENLYYEVRPTYSFEELHYLKRSGVNTFQPGIEALSTNILKILKKSLTASGNVRFLRDCKTLGIVPNWNLLHNIPDDTVKDYQSMIDIFPYLHHLTPPGYIGPLCIQRYSPLYDSHKVYKIKDLKPCPSYSFIFPDNVDFDKISLYFEGNYSSGYNDKSIKDDFEKSVKKWQETWKSIQPRLRLIQINHDYYLIEDTRPIAKNSIQIVTKEYFSLIEFFRNPVGHFKSLEYVEKFKLTDEFNTLLEQGIIIEIENKYLSLINEPKRVIDHQVDRHCLAAEFRGHYT